MLRKKKDAGDSWSRGDGMTQTVETDRKSIHPFPYRLQKTFAVGVVETDRIFQNCRLDYVDPIIAQLLYVSFSRIVANLRLMTPRY